MLCPTCDNVNLAMTDRQGIEIDYCPKCRGIWLDRGELDRLIERAEQAGVAPPPSAPVQRHDQPHARHPGHHDHRDHREGYPNKRRKSLLGELFDF
jgi:uncharacterized protein